jgi:hypothetical protein
MIVHGHDHTGRMELENFLLKNFPHVKPITMIDKSPLIRCPKSLNGWLKEYEEHWQF